MGKKAGRSRHKTKTRKPKAPGRAGQFAPTQRAPQVEDRYACLQEAERRKDQQLAALIWAKQRKQNQDLGPVLKMRIVMDYQQ